MKDRRLYARFTLDFPDSRKILPLSDAAFRCYVEAVIWSRKEESDGFLARRLALAKWSLDVLTELCNNDDENPSLIEREEGWYIHDYATQQDTKADIQARRDNAKAAGQKGGLAKAKQSAKRTASRPLSQPLSKNVAETETKTEIKEQEQKTCATALRDASDSFAKFWAAYPRRRDRRKAEKAFTNALKRADADTIIDGAHRYATDPNREDQFTKYAEGWLNADCWLDEPLPNRISRINGNHGPPIATSDLRVAQVQALKNRPERLEIEP